MRVDITKFEIALKSRGGESAVNFFHWLIEKSTSLERMNEVINTQIQHGSDRLIHQRKDYWATPGETLAKRAGDCEDSVFLKDFMSKFRGFAQPEQNHCLYCTWFNPMIKDAPGTKHMVLAHYVEPKGLPLILDNLTNEVMAVDLRTDLKPAFSFTAENIYIDDEVKSLESVRMSRWERYRMRCADEGIYF